MGIAPRQSIPARAIAFVARRVRRLALRILMTWSGGAFAKAANVYCALFRLKGRFGYDADKDAYFHKGASADETVWFKHRSIMLHYLDGFEARLDELRHDYLLDAAPLSPNDLVIDCGANIGEFGILAKKTQPEIRYLPVEPSPKEFSALQLNHPDREALQLGLWNEDGELDFYIASEEADNSLIAPRVYDHVIKTPVRRLDALIDGPVRLLKLEAEGGEPEILEGAGDALQQIDYITADVGFERGVREDSTLAPVANYLIQNGFELVDITYPRVVALFRRRGAA